MLNVQMTGLADNGTNVASSRVAANIGGVDIPVVQVIAIGSGHQVVIFLPQNVITGAQVPLTIAIDGRVSAATLISIRSN